MIRRILICLSLVTISEIVWAEGPKDERDRIVGVWNAIDRHVSLGSLYQPVHGVRKRESVIHFERKEEGLVGNATCPYHRQISFQERWKEGRTEFRTVRFEKDALTIAFDIEEWRITDGPISVEEKRVENNGTIRVEAKLNGDRLIGRWGMFTADGVEVFRGEWEAVRAKPRQ